MGDTDGSLGIVTSFVGDDWPPSAVFQVCAIGIVVIKFVKNVIHDVIGIENVIVTGFRRGRRTKPLVSQTVNELIGADQDRALGLDLAKRKLGLTAAPMTAGVHYDRDPPLACHQSKRRRFDAMLGNHAEY